MNILAKPCQNDTDAAIGILHERCTNALMNRTCYSGHHTEDSANVTLDLVADLMELRDGTNAGHTTRTRQYLRLLIDALGARPEAPKVISRWDTENVLAASRLHDVGKIAIADAILKKPGELTYGEFEQMKLHVPIGVAIIERMELITNKNTFLCQAKKITGTHHERWDGTGYPHGLRGNAIPLEGRLMAIADVYDALTSRRPYKPALCPEVAKAAILRGRSTHFDPFLVDLFEENFHLFALTTRSYT